MEVGVRVHIRDVETIDDVADVSAPAPVEAGDVVTTLEDVFRVEVVLVPPESRRTRAVWVRLRG